MTKKILLIDPGPITDEKLAILTDKSNIIEISQRQADDYIQAGPDHVYIGGTLSDFVSEVDKVIVRILEDLGLGKVASIKRDIIIPGTPPLKIDFAIKHRGGALSLLLVRCTASYIGNEANNKTTGIGRLLLSYQHYAKTKPNLLVRLFLVDSQISKKTHAIVKCFNLPITLLQWNNNEAFFSWLALNYTNYTSDSK